MFSRAAVASITLVLIASAVTATLCVRYAPGQDLLEVRGLGVLTGRITEEGADHIRFKSTDFGEALYSRGDILLLERTRAQGFYGLTLRTPDLRDISAQGIWRSLNGLITSDAVARRWSAQSVAEIRRVLYEGKDPADLYERVRREIRSGLGEQGRKRLTPMRLTGALFVFMALFFMAYFTVQVMVIMFSEGFMWGMSFLSLGYLSVADWLGGPFAAYLALLPPVAVSYFLATRWEAARSSVIGQIFSLNFGMIGVLILRAS